MITDKDDRYNFIALEALAQPIPAVAHPDDWRATHNDPLQSPARFIETAKRCYERRKGPVILVTIGIEVEISKPVASLISSLVGGDCFSSVEEWALGKSTPHNTEVENTLEH